MVCDSTLITSSMLNGNNIAHLSLSCIIILYFDHCYAWSMIIILHFDHCHVWSMIITLYFDHCHVWSMIIILYLDHCHVRMVTDNNIALGSLSCMVNDDTI